jgi:hypothetical protein
LLETASAARCAAGCVACPVEQIARHAEEQDLSALAIAAE